MSYSDSAAQRLTNYEAQVIIDATRLVDVLTSRQEYLDNGDEEDYTVDLAGEQDRLIKSVREFREWAGV